MARRVDPPTRRKSRLALLVVMLLAAVTAVVGSIGGAAQAAPAAGGYWMVDTAGKIYFFDATHNGTDAGTATVSTGAQAVKIAAKEDGTGFWVVDSQGVVSKFGTASFFNYTGAPTLAVGETVVTLSPTKTFQGFWLTTSQGRIFNYGDAISLPELKTLTGGTLNGTIVDSAPTVDGTGMYLVGSDGGVFAMGGAAFVTIPFTRPDGSVHFEGSMGWTKLNAPVRSLVPDPDGHGYWLVASDGGVFAFDAPFVQVLVPDPDGVSRPYGSMGSHALNKPITGMVANADGYLLLGTDGGIFNFSHGAFFGSLGGQTIPNPITSVAAFTSSVTLTSPVSSTIGVNGATSPVTLSAVATGGVTSVDFLIDGVKVNDPVVQSPAGTFSVANYNSWKLANGNHSVKAIGHVTGLTDVQSANKAFALNNTNSAATGGFPGGLVSLTFDDGWISHRDVALPALQARGLKGTFYIIGLTASGWTLNRFLYMSVTQLQEMKNAGMELGAHSDDHAHLPLSGETVGGGPASPALDPYTPGLTNMTAPTFINVASNAGFLTVAGQTREMTATDAFLASLGVAAPYSFASPYGETSATLQSNILFNTVTDAAGTHIPYVAHRSIDDGYNSASDLTAALAPAATPAVATPTSNRAHLLVQNVLGNTTAADVEGWIATARANNQWLILVMHDQVSTAPVDPNVYDNTPANLNLFLDSVVRSGSHVWTIKDVISNCNNVTNNCAAL